VLSGLVRGPKTLRTRLAATIRTVHRRGARAGQAGQKVSVCGMLPVVRYSNTGRIAHGE
jgi:hypothetical protein